MPTWPLGFLPCGVHDRESPLHLNGVGAGKSEVLSPLGLDYSSVDWVHQKGDDHGRAWPLKEGSSVKKGKCWEDSHAGWKTRCPGLYTSRYRTLTWLRRGHWASGQGGSPSWHPDYILVIAEQWTQLTPPQVCDNLLCAVGNQCRRLLSYFFNMSLLPWPLHLLPMSLFATPRDPYHPARIRIDPTSIANLCQQIISHFLDIVTLFYGICLIFW